MERRSFLRNAGILAGMGIAIEPAFGHTPEVNNPDNLQPVLLPALPPLEHNNGLAVRTWVRSEMTGGLYSSVETAVAPKTMGPPPHHHKELDELMYVVEGTASVIVGKDIVEIKAGGWHLRPRMLTHTFWNASDKTLRFIDMYFNQPFEQYLEKLFLELTEKNGYPEGSPAKIKEMEALNKKFGVVFSATAFKEMDDIKKQFQLK